MIIYYLTAEQFDKLWRQDDSPDNGWACDRIDWWREHMQHNTKLRYFETEHDLGYWGIFIGDAKHINWFLLNL